jgi:hypothetical protein
MMKHYILALCLIGCGDDLINATGSFTIAITNGQNGCNLQNWQVGSMASGIPLAVTQNGTAVTATVNGLTGTYMSLVLGSNSFIGSVSGNELDMKLVGTRPGNTGGCAYTINAEVSATLNGDILQGQIAYVPQTNHSPDCGVLNSCQSVQALNGTRPPSTTH